MAPVGGFKQFRNGAQFGAWLGLVPNQRSSGSKSNLSGYAFISEPVAGYACELPQAIWQELAEHTLLQRKC